MDTYNLAISMLAPVLVVEYRLLNQINGMHLVCAYWIFMNNRIINLNQFMDIHVHNSIVKF